MSRIYDIREGKNDYYLQSQTPNNYNKDNYFIKGLQDRVNSEWDYRPNRVIIEYENTKDSDVWTSEEVVIQAIKNDKGNDVSDDYRRLVFRDIQKEVPIGTKWRFSPEYNINSQNTSKNVWLVINKDSLSMTSSVVIGRCNYVLGSLYTDDKGVSRAHYEPAIIAKGLTSTSLFYNDIAITPQGSLSVVVQYNDFTKNYYINQRFVIGHNRIYKIKNISDAYSNSTFDTEDVGTMILYLDSEAVQTKDNFVTKIAWNTDAVVVENPQVVDNYKIILALPSVLPSEMSSEPVTFLPQLVNSNNEVIAVDCHIRCTLPQQEPSSINRYIKIEDLGNNSFRLTRKKAYGLGDLGIEFYVNAEDSPDHIEHKYTCHISMAGLY